MRLSDIELGVEYEIEGVGWIVVTEKLYRPISGTFHDTNCVNGAVSEIKGGAVGQIKTFRASLLREAKS